MGEGRARREGKRNRSLGHASSEGDERDAVAAAGRVLEQPEHDALRLLDHALGVHRPGVVDHEADGERGAVLAHLASEILGLDT